MMDAAFLQAWNGKFGAELQPPEWVFELGANGQENVERKITESARRVEKLQEDLDKELFLLTWLRKLSSEKDPAEVPSFSEGSVNHVQSETERDQDSLSESLPKPVIAGSPLDSPKQPPKPSPGTPDTAIGKISIQSSTTTSEDSPSSSSEYHTAGQNSSPEAESSLSRPRASADFSNRQRFIHSVSAEDLLVAKEVSRRAVKRHSSCKNLYASEKKEPGGKHKRIRSAPIKRLKQAKSPQPEDKAKKHLPSSPCTNSTSDPNTSASVHAESKHIKTSPLVKSQSQTGISEQVVLRDKVARRPSFPTMSQEEALAHWKGSGASSAAKRSSNSILDCEDYNFMVNDDEDSDPALINIMASRVRGTRTPRSSLSTDQPLSDFEKPERQVANGGGGGGGGRGDVTSPKEDQSNTPVPVPGAIEPTAGEPKKQMIAPLRKRSSTTQDTSPLKRVSYHYSDDECLTPKIDSGDHGTFPGNSPIGSNGCSNRNSRGSNGIIDEEDASAYEQTLRRQNPDPLGARKERTNTVTPGNVGSSEEEVWGDHSRLAKRPTEDPAARGSGEFDVTSTLTGSPLGMGGASMGGNDASIFEKSDSFTDELGSLDLDVELTLSKLRDKPDMSMATLLDMNENERMNARANTHPSNYKECTPEYTADSGEGIEIDAATISAFTLNNDLYGSRSNSASSLPGLFSESTGMSSASPPEQESPSHLALQGVNLRQSHGVKRSSNRKQRMGNPDFELMASGMSSDNEEKSHSRSSTSLTSEEDSIPTSPPSDDDTMVRACVRVRAVCLCVRMSYQMTAHWCVPVCVCAQYVCVCVCLLPDESTLVCAVCLCVCRCVCVCTCLLPNSKCTHVVSPN